MTLLTLQTQISPVLFVVSRAVPEKFAIFRNLVRLPVMAVGPKNALADIADSADTIWAKPVQKNGADVVE